MSSRESFSPIENCGIKKWILWIQWGTLRRNRPILMEAFLPVKRFQIYSKQHQRQMWSRVVHRYPLYAFNSRPGRSVQTHNIYHHLSPPDAGPPTDPIPPHEFWYIFHIFVFLFFPFPNSPSSLIVIVIVSRSSLSPLLAEDKQSTGLSITLWGKLIHSQPAPLPRSLSLPLALPTLLFFPRGRLEFACWIQPAVWGSK